MAEAFIVAAVRTAGGRRNGALREWNPAELGASVINELLRRTKADPALVDDLVFGCVTQAGEQAMNIARQCILASELPVSVPGVSVDRQCGSSQQALHFAAQAVISGSQDIAIAGGVESMTRVPMGAAIRVEGLPPYKRVKVIGERFPKMTSQFGAAEWIARKYGFDKETLDQSGFESQLKAGAAAKAGAFKEEILVIDGLDKEGNKTSHALDEGIRFDASIEAIRGVKLLSEDGRLTAATSSQVCDGASGVMVVNEKGLKALGIEPLARIHHMTVLGSDPQIMLETPIPATERALKRSGKKIDDIDLYEVNEAFASIPLAWLKAIGADPTKLNVNGGAMALGHPLGATGTKLMATLINALKARGKTWGLQTMCEGGGLSNVTIIERLN